MGMALLGKQIRSKPCSQASTRRLGFIAGMRLQNGPFPVEAARLKGANGRAQPQPPCCTAISSYSQPDCVTRDPRHTLAIHHRAFVGSRKRPAPCGCRHLWLVSRQAAHQRCRSRRDHRAALRIAAASGAAWLVAGTAAKPRHPAQSASGLACTGRRPNA